jgi:hypothetical protein
VRPQRRPIGETNPNSPRCQAACSWRAERIRAKIVANLYGQIGEEHLEVERSNFTITANDLQCPEQYVVDGRNMLRRGDSIIYNEERYTAATENIFYGPYWRLPPAVYLFWLNGELDGDLKIDLADRDGGVILKEHVLRDFADPLCVAVTQALERFEVRGYRTPSLKILRLDSVAVEAIRFPASA